MSEHSGGGGGPGGPPPNGGPPAPTATTQTPAADLSQQGSTGTTTTTSGDKLVAASITGLTMIRTAAGTRQVKVTIKATEKVTVTAKLTRGGRTLASRKVKLAAGTRTLRVSVPASVAAGAAKLALTLVDAAGNRKTSTRTVHIASRKT